MESGGYGEFMKGALCLREFCILSRVARFLLVHVTKTGKNVQNEHKMYKMVIAYPKCP
jgi:hypothetical protein